MWYFIILKKIFYVDITPEGYAIVLKHVLGNLSGRCVSEPRYEPRMELC